MDLDDLLAPDPLPGTAQRILARFGPGVPRVMLPATDVRAWLLSERLIEYAGESPVPSAPYYVITHSGTVARDTGALD